MNIDMVVMAAIVLIPCAASSPPQTMTAGTAAAVWRLWSLMQGKDTNTAARCARRSLATPGTPESILIYEFCTLD